MNRALAIASALAVAGAAPAQPQGRIVALEARLFYSGSGQLSANILDSKGRFSGWNTIIGEGGGKVTGAADDIMIVVKVAGPAGSQDELLLEGPLVVSARAGKKQLGQRRFTSMLVPRGGTSSKALYLADVGCAGRIDVTASLGKQTKTGRLDMMCGE